MSLNGQLGLAGWQWLFLAEGLPSIVLGVAVLFFLADRPSDAAWLSDDERQWLTRKLEAERRGSEGMAETSAAKALNGGIVWWLAVLIPRDRRGVGSRVLRTGADFGDVASRAVNVGYIIGAIGLAGVAGMLLNGATPIGSESGSRMRRGRCVMAAGFIVTAMSRQGPMVIAGLVIISFGVNAFLPVFGVFRRGIEWNGGRRRYRADQFDRQPRWVCAPNIVGGARRRPEITSVA